MYTPKTHRFGRAASETAAIVVLALAYAATSAFGAEPGDVDTPDELVDQPIEILDRTEPSDFVRSVIARIPLAEAIEMHRRAEQGIEAPQVTGLDPDMVAGAIEQHFTAEHGPVSTSIGPDPDMVAGAIEQHFTAEHKD